MSRARAKVKWKIDGHLSNLWVYGVIDTTVFELDTTEIKSVILLKFMFSKKATEIDKIFTVDLTLCSHTTYTIRNKSWKCAGMGLNGFQIK